MTYFVTTLIILAALILADQILKTRVILRWRIFILAFGLGLIVVIPWDMFAITRGHWWFDELLGIYIGVLPIEEIIAITSMFLIPVIAWEYFKKKK